MNDTSDDEHRDDPWLLTGDLPCLGCEYNLRGLVGPVVTCPECARENDLREPEPWQVKQKKDDASNRPNFAASLFVASLGPCIIVFTFDRWTVLTVINGLIVSYVLILWLKNCFRWMKACRSVLWAVHVLILYHVAIFSSTLAILGMLVLLEFLSAIPPIFTWRLVFLSPLALFTLRWSRRILRRGGERGEFHPYWRKWRLPVAVPGDQRDASAP